MSHKPTPDFSTKLEFCFEANTKCDGLPLPFRGGYCSPLQFLAQAFPEILHSQNLFSITLWVSYRMFPLIFLTSVEAHDPWSHLRVLHKICAFPWHSLDIRGMAVINIIYWELCCVRPAWQMIKLWSENGERNNRKDQSLLLAQEMLLPAALFWDNSPYGNISFLCLHICVHTPLYFGLTNTKYFLNLYLKN